MKTLKIEIWGPVVKCATLSAPRQSRRAQKCLASLETASAGKWDLFLSLRPKTGMFSSEGVLNSHKIYPLKTQHYLPKFSKIRFLLASSVFCRQFHGTRFWGPPPALPPGFARQLSFQPVAGKIATVVTAYSNYGLVSLHTKLTVNIFTVCGNSDF